jgi:SET domain-containing protein
MKSTYVSFSATMGRGVYAAEWIEKNDVIMADPSLLITTRDYEIIKQTSLGTYPFEFPDGSVRLVLGRSSLINHSNTPNVEKLWSRQDWLWIVALRDIDVDEQLFHDYSFDPGSEPAWAK